MTFIILLNIFKDGVFDSDYQFRLVERGGGKISLLEYKEWRRNGMAFTFEENPDNPNNSTATQPNMSLVSSTKATGKGGNGKSSSSKSFFGDIVTGPFLSYGLETSYEALSVDKTKISRPSQDLALARIKAMIENVEKKVSNKEEPDSISIEIVFLPLSAERDIKRSSKEFENKFDVCFIACSVAHVFGKEFAKNIVSGGAIIVETPLFLLHMAKEIQEKFKEHLMNITAGSGDSGGLKLVDESYDPLKSSTVMIKKN